MNFPLFETLCIENGTVKNIALHQQRYEQSLHRFYAKSAVNIYDILQQIEKTAQFSTALCHGLVRCRFDYNRDDCLIRFFPYQRTSYRTFKPIVCDEIDYALKYNDRTVLTKLFDRRDNCDEVIIIKQGKVTDCTIKYTSLQTIISCHHSATLYPHIKRQTALQPNNVVK